MTPEPWRGISTSASTSSEDLILRVPIRKRCRVPACPNPQCALRSHRKYKPDIAVKPEEQLRKNNLVASNSGQLIRRDPQSSIQRDGVDGLPVLPLEAQDPQLRLLFNHFFTNVFEPLARSFRGPSVASMAEYKTRMLAAALGSESYCMGLILQSQTDINISRHQRTESRQSIEVYTKAVVAFRKEIRTIEKRPHPMQIELALLSLCTMISYECFQGRTMPVQTHWHGLQQLVNRRGGLHAVTVSLAYVVHVDRMCAQRLNQRPAYANPTLQSMPLPKPQCSKYGSALLRTDVQFSSTFMLHVLEHCLETSDLLELWELSYGHQAVQPQKGTRKSAPSLEYLYYIRDRVDEQFTLLHAELWNQDVRDKCLLWAARVVEYPVTWSNQIPTLNTHICDHLVRTLRTQDMSEVWRGNSNMLIWILFVLATVQTPFEGRDEVITYLQRIISLKHGDQQWPRDWWKTELANVRSLVWSDSANTGRFYGVCRELDIRAPTDNVELQFALLNTSPPSD